MGSFLKLMWDMLKIFLFFTGCTLLFYYGLLLVNREYESYHRYDEPEGRAIKAASMVEDLDTDWYNRLIYYFHSGE